MPAMLRVAVLVALAASGCGPKLIWHGRSPDRMHALRVVEHHGQFVVLDGVRGPTFDAVAIGALAFSPDSRHLAYAARRAGRWRMVVDGREGPPLDGLGEVTYSADSGHLAYAGELGKTWRVIADGHEGPLFDALLDRTLGFSPDGRRLAYVGIRAGGVHVVVDGVVGPSWSGVGNLGFSADGLHVAYVARRDGVAVAVVDGVSGPSYEAISELALGPRGRVAYLAQQHGLWRAVVDGVAGPTWDLARGLVFSADGAHVAYVARRTRGDSFVVVDGVEDTSFVGIRPASVAFAGGDARPTYVARRGNLFLVVHAGSEGPPFDDVRPPVYSADGSRWGYVGRRAETWIPVVDGVEARSERWASDPVLSASGGRVAYLVRRGRDMAVIVDGKVHGFDLVMDGTLVFDPTGRHWGCVAGVRSERRFHIIVDGVRQDQLDVTEAIDAAMRTKATGEPLGENNRILHDWVAAEVARAAR